MNGKRRFADSARKAFVFLVAPFLLVALTGTARPAPAACPVAVAGTGLISVAYAGAPAVPAGHVRLTFAGHASFLIETPGGASVFTDYNGYVRPPRLPDIVTMNNFHDTHYTDYVEPEIRFVLRAGTPMAASPGTISLTGTRASATSPPTSRSSEARRAMETPSSWWRRPGCASPISLTCTTCSRAGRSGSSGASMCFWPRSTAPGR